MSTDLNIESIDGCCPGDEIFLIAGPCSAESESQMMRIADDLSDVPQLKYFRAGIWKPRTRPDIFEGVGEIGLQWLKDVKQKYGYKTAVEVATPQHIELCLKYDVDLMWIGARTTVNPFSVQELADAVKGVDTSIFVKNPLHPELKLWIGAIERFNKSGIKRLGAIHRGFYSYDNQHYRNLPMWEIPIELKRIAPELPIINDPSHIGGKRNLIAGISQKALDLAMDGLMIETHNDPDNALTDSKQQITAERLKQILDKLVIKKIFGDTAFEDGLEKLRAEINDIDRELLNTLARRMQKSADIGKFKKENGITVLQIKRFQEMLKERLEIGEELGLDSGFVMRLLQLVHRESVQLQFEVFK
jgi:chorismate mutase